MIRMVDMNTEIIYCTSSADFALASYEVFAFGYLLKSYEVDKLSLLLDHYFQKNPFNSFKGILLKVGHTEQNIFFKDIIYVESQDKIVLFHTVNKGVIKKYDKLNNVEAMLVDSRFLRCHQSYIMNMDMVAAIDGSDFISITNERIPIRNRDKKSLISTYSEYTMR